MQCPAKEARRPFERGDLTKNTAGKFFGVKIFVVLAIKYQRLDQGDERQAALNARISATCTLSTVCGLYAQLLYDVLALIDTARRKGKLTEVRRIESPRHRMF